MSHPQHQTRAPQPTVARPPVATASAAPASIAGSFNPFPNGEPAPKAPDGPKRLLCGRTSCEMNEPRPGSKEPSGIDISYVAPEQVERFALVHGFVRAANPAIAEAKRQGRPAPTNAPPTLLYCSKRCAALHAWDVESETRIQKGANAPIATNPTSIRVRVTRDVTGAAVRWVECDRLSCASQFEPPPGDDPLVLVRAAISHGYVQSTHGVFCSIDCAKKVTAEVAAGQPTKASAPEPPTAARVATKSVRDNAGATRWVQCERFGCPTQFEAEPGADAETLVRAAKAHGFVAHEGGVYCTLECAKRVRDGEVSRALAGAKTLEGR